MALAPGVDPRLEGVTLAIPVPIACRGALVATNSHRIVAAIKLDRDIGS